MTNVLKITDQVSDRPPQRTVDLRGDNLIQELLDEYEEVSRQMSEATERRKQLHGEIMEKLAGARTALVDGWRVKVTTIFRKEHLVKASEFDVLRIKRKSRRSQIADRELLRYSDARLAKS